MKIQPGKYAALWAGCAVFFAVASFQVFSWSGREGAASATLAGSVLLEDGSPVAGATVRVKGTRNSAVSDGEGRFSISGIPPGNPLDVSAWKQGYYGALLKDAAGDDLKITLIEIQAGDNANYEWIPPVNPEKKGSCAECHDPALMEMSLEDPHVKSGTNPRFLTMYRGTDTEGNRGPLTRYGSGTAIWRHIMVPMAPDPSEPDYGPGFQLDSPSVPGNCSACHVPGASIEGDIDPANAKGADKFGIQCDFCHKISDVRIDPVTRLPFVSYPGVHSMKVKRPFTEDNKRPQVFFGTFDDDNLPDAKLPLLSESRYCAACHFGVFWSTVAYNSYGEWLNSPYADPGSGKAKTCQECHMVSPTAWKGKTLTNLAPEKGAIERDPKYIHSHLTKVNEDLLRECVTLTARAGIKDGKLTVEVSITNDKTGHHVPSDCPLRHLILLVEAKDGSGKKLEQTTGPKIPAWCGIGDPSKGHYYGFPTAAYWRHTTVASDNRLAAFATDKSSYSFVPSETGGNNVTVILLYRRAFISVMEKKKWQVPDIVMARKEIKAVAH
jgi:hypothetical protein